MLGSRQLFLRRNKHLWQDEGGEEKEEDSNLEDTEEDKDLSL